MEIVNKITNEKLKSYFHTTESAFLEAKKSISKGKEDDAKEILEMAECYINDAHHFEKNKDFVNAFAALNYAHGWLDTGSRLGIFLVKNNKLFVIR